MLCDHGIWQDVKIWRELIAEIIQTKMVDQDKIRKRKEKIMSQSNGGGSQDAKSFFKKGFKQLKGML